MRKLLACLVAVVMVLSIMPVAFAADTRVVFTDFRYTDGTYGIARPENGLVNTEVRATIDGAGEQTVTLVVMLCDKETGKIKATASDVITLNAETPTDVLSTGLTVNDITTEDYKYFLWDGVTTHTPLDNAEPAKPENIVDSENKPSAIELSWDEAYDDFDDVEYYNVYNNGVLISSDSDTNALDKNLDKNTTQNYTIEAIDGEGLVSQKAEFSVKTADVANIEMSAPEGDTLGVTENGVYLWIPVMREITGTKAGDKGTYGYTEAVTGEELEEVWGRECRVAPSYDRSGSTLIGRFHVKVDSAHINADDSNVTMDITYFDDDTQNISVQYVNNQSTGDAGASKSSSVDIKKTGTNLWKTSTVKVTNANYRYSMDDGSGRASFRLWQGTAGLKISNIAVANTSEYNGDAAGLRVKDVPEIRDVIFYMNDAELVQDEDVNYVQIEDGESLDFDITDTRLNGVSRVAVEIEYFDEGEGNIDVTYKNTSNSTSTSSVSLTNSGTWKKAKIDIANAMFTIGGAVSTDDLVIDASGQALKIKTVRIYDAR